MHHILAEQAREAAARRQLQHSRRWAGGLLFAAVLLFIGSSLHSSSILP